MQPDAPTPPATVRPPLDLDAIRARADKATPGPWEHVDHGQDGTFMGCGQVVTMGENVMGGDIAGPTGDCYPRSGYDPRADMEFIANARQDIPALADEVESLRVDLTASGQACERLRELLDAARAERTEPATGDVAAFEDVALSVVGQVNTVRSKPATGEDWNVVYKAVKYWDKNNADEITDAVLAALDLPGRERALREERDRAQRELTELRYVKAGVEEMYARLERHIPEDYDGDEAYEAIFERWVNDVVAERDAANAALVDVTRQRDEAREDAKQAWFYLSRSRAEVAEEIAVAIEEHSDRADPTRQSFQAKRFREVADLARQHATKEDADEQTAAE